jgi:peptide/nickel transport system substrate-binding protein
MFLYGWYPDFIDPYDYTYPFFNSAANSWLHAGYNNSQMDALTNQALVASSSSALSLYQQIQTLQAKDVPTIPLFQGGANCCGAVAKPSVSGVYLDVTLIFRLYTLREGS